MLNNRRNFTIKAYEIQQVIQNYMNIPLRTISWLGGNNKGRNVCLWVTKRVAVKHNLIT